MGNLTRRASIHYQTSHTSQVEGGAHEIIGDWCHQEAVQVPAGELTNRRPLLRAEELVQSLHWVSRLSASHQVFRKILPNDLDPFLWKIAARVGRWLGKQSAKEAFFPPDASLPCEGWKHFWEARSWEVPRRWEWSQLNDSSIKWWGSQGVTNPQCIK